jgi:hypothetical protein
MPKVRLRNTITEIQGTLYDVVFKRSAQGNMIVTKRPDMSQVEWSEAQKQQRQRFKQAVAHVRAALSDPVVRLRYERKAKKQKKRAWDLAMSDYFQGKGLFAKK